MVEIGLEIELFQTVCEALLERKIFIRSPNSTRPWQHVLEPVSGYLLLAKSFTRIQKGSPLLGILVHQQDRLYQLKSSKFIFQELNIKKSYI